ncbi:MAG: hypothetical protein IIB12_06565, partial [Chloroflexi bacterium]|nr:hypothetical protein [Chloroflexota bacterium]
MIQVTNEVIRPEAVIDGLRRSIHGSVVTFMGTVRRYTEDREVYYFNIRTGESIWDHPMDAYYKALFKQEKAKLSKRRQSMRLFAGSLPSSGLEYPSPVAFSTYARGSQMPFAARSSFVPVTSASGMTATIGNTAPTPADSPGHRLGFLNAAGTHFGYMTMQFGTA